MSIRQLRGSIGGHESWARTVDRSARTAPGRAAFEAKFLQEVDPEGVLPLQERIERAANARKAFYRRLALSSAEARRRSSAEARHRKSPQSLEEFLRHLRRGQTPPAGQQWFGEGCCICGQTSKLVTDHDHATGIARGLLCRSCNTLEGIRSDSDDFGLWALWRMSAPGLETAELYIPVIVRSYLDAHGLKAVPS